MHWMLHVELVPNSGLAIGSDSYGMRCTQSQKGHVATWLEVRISFSVPKKQVGANCDSFILSTLAHELHVAWQSFHEGH